jgi:DNA-binding IclR family transcriptional regulator
MEAAPGDEEAGMVPAEGGADRAAVQSVAIAVAILKTLAAAGGVLPLRQIAVATGMPRAKVHRYLASLRSTGLIAQNPESGEYQIGPAAVTIGLVGLGRLGPVRQLHEAMPRLRDRINQTVTAAIWAERGPTIVAIEESDHVVTMNVRIGTVLPLLTTAIGRLFLAYLPTAVTRRFLAAERRMPTAAAYRPSEEDLAAILADIRARRLSRATSALIPGVDAVAAPVFDYRGKLVAVMCVVAHAGSISDDRGDPIVTALADSADELSRRLGFVELEGRVSA